MRKDESKIILIFSRNLSNLISSHELTQLELANKMGVSQTTISEWINGKKMPRMDKIDRLCDIFNCRRADLILSEEARANEPYYYDPQARELAEFLHKNPKYKVLFDAARDVSVDDIDFVKRMIDAARSAHDGSDYDK